MCNDFEISLTDKRDKVSLNTFYAKSNYLQVRFLNDNESVPSTIFPEGNQFNVVQKKIVSIYNHEQSLSPLMIS